MSAYAASGTVIVNRLRTRRCRDLDTFGRATGHDEAFAGGHRRLVLCCHLVGLDPDVGSPLATRSPGAFSHRSTLPVSCDSWNADMMTFVGIAYLPSSAESPGAICESPSCTTDATSAPSRVNTLPRAIARPPALEATYCE